MPRQNTPRMSLMGDISEYGKLVRDVAWRRQRYTLNPVISKQHLLTYLSVMESHRARDVKMTDLYARLVVERRQSSSSYQEGLFTSRIGGLINMLTCTSYAEVLENTQYALIATVQKLYTMIRNGESWELGEPEMNDRGQPVIHDIASRLGCIRPSPDLPYSFPEGESDFAELQAQLEAARSEMGREDVGSRKATSSIGSPVVDREERASSVESDHSQYNQLFQSPQKQQAPLQHISIPRSSLSPVKTAKPTSIPTNMARKPASFDSQSYRSRTSFDTASSLPSPVYTDFQTESPLFQNMSPFSSWSGNDDFLGQPHALDLAAQYMRQSQPQYNNGMGVPNPSPLHTQVPLDANMMKAISMNDFSNFSNGTIRPGMLDCNTGFDMSDPMDTMIYGTDYDAQMTMAWKTAETCVLPAHDGFYDNWRIWSWVG